MPENETIAICDVLMRLWFKAYELYRDHAESDLGNTILEKILIPIQTTLLEFTTQ